MESVSRHFPPPPLLYLALNFLRLSRTDTRRVRWTLAKAIRLHRIRCSPFADIFHPYHYFTLRYIFQVSRELTRGESNILLPRQPVSIGSDGVLPFAYMYFHLVRDFILCCIFNKFLTNWLPVSLVVHGLRPSHSVWVYWTTFQTAAVFRVA